ncbi:hypothetical protein M758_3G106900 [Ceratodon purpureus]|nr:hypothetical protein M758_3G106900 [Ceratodon purpureus]
MARLVSIVCSGGQVRYGTLLGDGKVTTKSLARHRGRAHKMAIEPGSPRVFYSCGEDGVVQHFDLREEKSTKLLTCHHFSTGSDKAGKPRVLRLNAIVMNPRNCNYIAVGGSDQYARVYDIRRVAGMDDQPVDFYAPKHLQGPGHEEHITCVAYSKQEEILVSYNDELIYLFDQSMSLGTSPQSNAEDGVKREDDGPHPESNKPQVYQGHRNLQTVKGVNFFGPNTEYIVSGSDCGRVFIWKKRGGKLVALFKGDKSVVNCLEPHPYATILATSGIDDTIKVWAPLSDTTLELPEDAEKVMENNKRRRENHATSIPLTPELLRNLLLLRHLQAPTDGEGRRSTRVSFEGWSPDAEDEETSDDGDTVNPRECTIS